MFKCNKDDNWDLWGKYTGTLKSPINGDNTAHFDFYLRGNNITINYWKSYEYKDMARKMAVRAIDMLNEALS